MFCSAVSGRRYITADGGFVLVPPASEERAWAPGDRLIVLS